MSRLEARAAPVDRVKAEVAVAFFYEDLRPLAGPAALLDGIIGGKLAEMLASGAAVGRAGESVLIPSGPGVESPWVLFVGGGCWHGLGEEALAGLFRFVTASCRRAGFGRVALGLERPPEIPESRFFDLLEAGFGDASAESRWLLALSGSGDCEAV